MTNNKQQTEINAVEYLDKVNQFAKENNTDKPKQQTAVEWLLNAIETKNGEEFSSYYSEFIEQAKEMQKEQSQAYAAFCVGCDRKKLPLLEFDGWVKLGDEQ